MHVPSLTIRRQKDMENTIDYFKNQLEESAPTSNKNYITTKDFLATILMNPDTHQIADHVILN